MTAPADGATIAGSEVPTATLADGEALAGAGSLTTVPTVAVGVTFPALEPSNNGITAGFETRAGTSPP
jgi:hypothetical protein